MKRLVFVVLILLMVSKSFAKTAKMWVEDLDKVKIETISKDSACLFWLKQRRADIDFQSLSKAIAKRKKSLIEAETNVKAFLNKSNQYKQELVVTNDSMVESLCDNIERDLKIAEIKTFFPDVEAEDLHFEIAAVNDFNASTYPDGCILIYTGLFSMLNYEELLAVCAHELVHYMFRHSLSKEYSYIKRKKSNQVWAGIGAGLLIGVSAAAEGYARGLNTSTYSNYNSTYNSYRYAEIYEEFLIGAEESANYFRFRYSRKDELQADVIGCRYLQFLGYDGKSYLSMLEKLGTENDKDYSKESTHPKTKLRLQVIKALLEKGKS